MIVPRISPTPIAMGLYGALRRKRYQKPPMLDYDALVVDDYLAYVVNGVAVINCDGKDVQLLTQITNGEKVVLQNIPIVVMNFKNAYSKGLDIECNDPELNATRMLLFRGDEENGTEAAATESIFIEGLHINNKSVHGNMDAIAMYWVGSSASPMKSVTLQNSLIEGVGIEGNEDELGYHPDALQFQGGVFTSRVYVENFTCKTRYQAIYAPWEENTGTPANHMLAPAWSFMDVNIKAEDPSAHRLVTCQSESGTAAQFPQTLFANVYLEQGQTHPWGIGCANVHVDPNLDDNSPYNFVPEAAITNVPFGGAAPVDFVTADEVGIYY